MGRQTKATRKFESKHLKGVIEKRNAVKKIKQRNARTSKARSDKKEEVAAARENGAKKQKEDVSAPWEDGGPKLFENMSVEQFFKGGFEVPAESAQLKKKKKAAEEKVEKNSAAETAKAKKVEKQDKEEELDGGSSSEGEEGNEEATGHKSELAALAEKDPEFFKYLQENDSELLDFKLAEKDDLHDLDDFDSEEGSEMDEDGDEEGPRRKKQKKSDNRDEISTDLKLIEVKKWKKSLEESHSLKTLRQIELAFRSAVHVGDADAGKYKYTINNPQVYHELVVLALTGVPNVLKHHIPVKESASGKVRIDTDTKKYRALGPLLKSHSASVLHLLSTLTDPATTKLLLNSTLDLVPYLLGFRKFLRDFVREVVEIWSSATTEESTRITAYLVLRRLVTIGDSALREACLKAVYSGFLKGCRNTSAHTLPGINLIKNGGADLLGVDQEGTYVLGFGYIRQLAIHLRNSITNNSNESYKTVYNWQYIHSLDFWSRVLSTHCDGLKEAESGKESPLRPLIYPLVQVTLGAARLIPTAQYFPLRLHLIRSLIRLSRCTGAFIPLSSVILEMLSSNELKHSPKPSTLRQLVFAASIRASKSYLRTRVYQDGLGEQIVEVLSEFFLLYTKSIAFPELVMPSVVVLRKFIKKASAPSSGNKNAKVNNSLVMLVQKVEANSKFIEDKRKDVSFAPNRREEIDGFLKDFDWEKTPLGVYVLAQRKVREERRRILEEAAAREKKKHGAKNTSKNDDDMMSDISEDEDNEDEDEDNAMEED